LIPAYCSRERNLITHVEIYRDELKSDQDQRMSSKQYTLMDVYHAAKSDRKFDYFFWGEITCGIVAEYVFLQLGRVLVMVASALITTICASGFLIVLPVVAEPGHLWFYFNIVWGKLKIFALWMLIFTFN
jgi:hypothetical protein